MKQSFKVEGMSCSHCVMAVKKELTKINITNAEVEIGKITLDTEKNNITSEQIKKAVVNAGYKIIES